MSIRMKTEDGDIILSGKGKDGKDGESGIPVPQVAEVGQVLAVKAVDENGKPTEWECVEKGGGSGGDIQTFIVDGTHAISWDFTPSSYSADYYGIYGFSLVQGFQSIVASVCFVGDTLTIKYRTTSGSTSSANVRKDKTNADVTMILFATAEMVEKYGLVQVQPT